MVGPGGQVEMCQSVTPARALLVHPDVMNVKVLQALLLGHAHHIPTTVHEKQLWPDKFVWQKKNSMAD